MKPEEVSLVLFLTRNVPMEIWHKSGILNREMSIYERLALHFHRITFVSCGNNRELAFLPNQKNISILNNRWNLSPNLYSFVAPFLHRKHLLKANIFKTNQLDGSWTAIIAGWLFHKPVIVRAGYIWSDFFLKEGGRGIKATLVNMIEKWCLWKSHHIFVTTIEIKDHMIDKYNLPADKITIIPNFIDTNIFYPNSDIIKTKGRICFVGRLAPIKNIDILIQAVSQIPNASLVVIGNGKHADDLNALSKRLHANVLFLGQLDHKDLPAELCKSDIFVLPSALEGHPKVLIEAMACGCAVIGADVPGIRSIIRHGQNGYLCSPTVEGVRDAITHLLNNEALRNKIGENAAVYAKNEFSLENIAEMETKAILDCFAKI